MVKYKTSKCKNCKKDCWGGSYVCGLCYVKIFKNNKNNCYDDWRYSKLRKEAGK